MKFPGNDANGGLVTHKTNITFCARRVLLTYYIHEICAVWPCFFHRVKGLIRKGHIAEMVKVVMIINYFEFKQFFPKVYRVLRNTNKLFLQG